MSSEVSRETVEGALGQVVDPCSIATGVPISLLEMGLIQNIEIVGTRVTVVLRLTSPICMQVANIFAMVEERVLALTGVTNVTCTVDPVADWEPEMMSADARDRLRRRRDPAKLKLSREKEWVGQC